MTTESYEPCNCEQAIDYRKLGRKLANAIMRYATHENQEKYGSVYYLAEKVVPLADDFLKLTKNIKPKE